MNRVLVLSLSSQKNKYFASYSDRPELDCYVEFKQAALDLLNLDLEKLKRLIKRERYKVLRIEQLKEGKNRDTLFNIIRGITKRFDKLESRKFINLLLNLEFANSIEAGVINTQEFLEQFVNIRIKVKSLIDYEAEDKFCALLSIAGKKNIDTLYDLLDCIYLKIEWELYLFKEFIKNIDNEMGSEYFDRMYDSKPIKIDIEMKAGKITNKYEANSLITTITFIIANQNLGDIYCCENCKRFFLRNRKGLKYCNSPSPQDQKKTCVEFARYQRYKEQTHKEAAILHKQNYNKLKNQWERSKDYKRKEKFESYIKHAEIWRDKVKEGKATETEYIKWLCAVKDGEGKL